MGRTHCKTGQRWQPDNKLVLYSAIGGNQAGEWASFVRRRKRAIVSVLRVRLLYDIIQNAVC